MHSFTESFALYIQFISIYLYFDKFVYTRLRAIYGNHILLTKLLSRMKERSWKVKHGVDRSSCTNTRANVSLSSSSLNTIHTHTQPLIHTNRMFWLTHFKNSGTQFGILYGNYTSQCYLSIFIYTKAIYTHDLKSRETIASFRATKDGNTVTVHDVHEISVTL
jgi:hypothetical protein